MGYYEGLTWSDPWTLTPIFIDLRNMEPDVRPVQQLLSEQCLKLNHEKHTFKIVTILAKRYFDISAKISTYLTVSLQV